MKECTKCHEMKPRSSFYSRPNGKIKTPCKACHLRDCKVRDKKRNPDRPTRKRGRANCIVEDCGNLSNAKGYCIRHLYLRTDKICKEDGCGLGYQSRGYCHKHFEYYRRETTYRHKDKRKCLALKCNNEVCKNDYCAEHQKKVDNGLDPNIDYKVGENNHRWNNGVSDYPNHRTMRKIRLVKIGMVNNQCEECGSSLPSSKLQAHHLDGSKDNHALDNIKILCHKCHMSIYHSGARHPYKGNKEYSAQYLRNVINA